MSHTNETPNYHLPQYVGTDIINPLVDTNGAYSAIDTALKDISDNEVTDAGKILALETTVGDSNNGLVKDVAGLQEQNGDSVLTTDAQTLSSAINEIDAHTDTNTGNIADNALAITGLQNTVGNANSGLVKDVADLQTAVGDANSGLVKDVADNASAITGLQTTVGDSNSGLVKDVGDIDSAITNKYLLVKKDDLVIITGDGVKTYGEMLADALAGLNAYIAAHTDEYIRVSTISLSGVRYHFDRPSVLYNTALTGMLFSGCDVSSSSGHIYGIELRPDSANCHWRIMYLGTTPSISVGDLVNDTFPNGSSLYFEVEIYKKVS